MPVYYDMLVSQSPPIFSHSPPTGFLSDFASNNRYESPRFCRPSALTPPTARRHFSGQQPPPSLYQTHLQNLTPIKMPIVTRVEPKRSCLVVRPGDHKYCTFDANGDEKESDNDESSDSDERGTRSSSSRSKRRVVFADDKGLELEHVKVMSEASNQPPTWSLQFLAHVTQGMISPVPLEQWTIDFRQPASDYLEFR